ncbi:hypothetical protein [Sphingomonas jatrophae]|uniref:Uncharacterized protein n=1 Tax=Sphingomonas jatrophae TaxID=1166337 RepID=A0A1I6M732_9SPHN|nr:hypothetical protein [Sphingomonas jatrophae]SFS11418.1 hypothetical protein SAMN05192580_3578 [Sphingomonas jatrophae]
MQRVRIGLTGLCSVFLLVLLAAAIFGLAPKEPSASEPKASPAAANAVDANPKDPLAELGVTPGGSQSDPEPAAAPPTATPPGAMPAAAPAPAAKPAP